MPTIQEKFKADKKPNKAKAYLMRVRWINDDIKREEEEIQQLTAMAEGIKAVTYDTDKVQTSTGDHLSDSVIKLIDHKLKLEADIIEMVELRDLIRKQIADMPDPIHRQILFRYYLDCQLFEKIACDLNYSYQYIINAHGRALQAFEKLYMI